MISLGGLVVGCANSPADYRWLSSENNILSVSATGVVQAKRPGKATVKVVSIFDDLNFYEVTNACLLLTYSTFFFLLRKMYQSKIIKSKSIYRKDSSKETIYAYLYIWRKI